MIAGLRGTVARKLPEPVLQVAFDLLQGKSKPQSAIRTSVARRRMHSALARMKTGVAPVRHLGETLLSQPVSTFSARNVEADNLAIAIQAAEGAGLPHSVLRRHQNKPPALVLAGDGALRMFLNSVEELAGGRPFYVQLDGGKKPSLLGDLPTSAADPLTLFEWISADGTVLAGKELGCRILTTPVAEQIPVITDVIEPVDVVYTWVDGADPEWAQEKSRAQSLYQPHRSNAFSANAERYRSHDELRYSLRSVDYFAPWVNHVYLVTAGQVPEWIEEGNPRITVIDHSVIFPPDALPTFNSHAIEARLHHIPGLSEHFLYLNDDVFFGRHVQPDLFFLGNGLSKFFLSDQTVDDASPAAWVLPVDNAARQNRALLQQRFGRTSDFKFKHAAHPQRVSTLRALEQDFAEKHEETTRSRFRNPEDISIPSSLAHYYGFAKGTAVPGRINYRYCDIGDVDARAKLLRLLRHRDADVFCLNEIGGSSMDPAKQDELVGRFLRSYFPVPSSFETGA